MFKFLFALSLAACSTQTWACANDYDCEVGFKCVKSGGYSSDGVCVGNSYGGGAPKDSGYNSPLRGDKAGNSCSSNYDCSVGGQCLKSGSSIYGTCSK